MTVELHLGDCLDIMPALPQVDAIITDLPYGTTACSWDEIIPFEPMWREVKRICKGAFVTTASQPFTSKLVMSNPNRYKYSWVWEKNVPTGFLNAKKQPLRWSEDILVFYNGFYTYNPQLRSGNGFRVSVKSKKSENYGNQKNVLSENDGEHYYPKNIIKFNNENGGGKLHPTQKPTELYEYLIRTYTNEGDTVLDICAGSGTTGVACVNTNRNFIGIELREDYFKIMETRIADAQLQMRLPI